MPQQLLSKFSFSLLSTGFMSEEELIVAKRILNDPSLKTKLRRMLVVFFSKHAALRKTEMKFKKE